MVCRIITRSTRPIAGDETVLTVSNALPRGPYHPSLLACPSPLFLSSRCYLSGDLCRNVQLVDLPGPPPSFLRGRQPVIAELCRDSESSGCWPRVSRRLSCLCTSHRDDACKERQQMLSSECSIVMKGKYPCILFYCIILYSLIFFISLFNSPPPPLSCSLLRPTFLFDRTIFTFPLCSAQRLLAHLGDCPSPKIPLLD